MSTADRAASEGAPAARSAKTARGVIAFGAGLVFAIGLGVAGMTRPSKVLGFLDVGGDWDPSLAFVMGAALVVYGVTARVVLRRDRPLFDAKFFLPTRKQIDAPLVVGAMLFGVGWGLSGYCPGPAIVSSVTGATDTLVFTAAMILSLSFAALLGSSRGSRARAP